MQEHYTPPQPSQIETQAPSTPSPRRRAPARPTPENIYNNRTGEWTGQLRSPALAVSAQPKLPRPRPDRTLKSLVDWVYKLHLLPTPFAVLMAIVSHVDWATGRSCYASRESLARRAGVSIGTLRRQLAYLKNAGIIDRRQRLAGNAETWLVLDSPAHQAELPLQPESEYRTSVMKVTGDPLEKVTGDPLEKVTGDPLEKVTGDPLTSSVLTNSSSTNPINQSVQPSASKSDDEQDLENGVDDLVRRRTGTEQQSGPPPAAHAERPTLAAEVALFMSRFPPVPDVGFCLAMLNRYWKVWGAEHVKGGWQCPPQKAAEEYCKSSSMWAKFRSDLVAKVIKLGPPPMLENGQFRPEPVRCEGCGAMTTVPIGPIWRRAGGERRVDQCGDCPVAVGR